MEVIPAILESNWLETEKKIKIVDGLTNWIQIDVSDGEFVKEKIWNNSKDLFSLDTKSKIEIHLLIKEPWLKAEEWLSSPAKRICVHVEAFSSPESVRFDEILFTAQKYGKDIVWSFKLETDWKQYEKLMQKPHAHILLMSVDPGRQGQEFNSEVFNKISSIKEKYPHVKIFIDGGVSLDNIADIKDAGVDFAIVGSAIFDSKDPKKSLEKFLL